MNLRTRLSRSQSKSFARTRRERRIWASGLIVVVLLAWVFVMSRISWLGVFIIENVQVYGADPDIVPALRDAALSQLDGSYIGLFSRANDLLYPKQDIAAAVRAASPRIQDVDVRRAGGHGLAINVTERLPAAIVCAELPDLSDDIAGDPDCYLADETGLIFQSAPTSSPQTYRRYFEPDLASPLGSYATSTAKFTELQSFFDSVHDAGIVPLGLLLKDGGEYELYIANPAPLASAAHATSTDARPDIAVIYFNDVSSTTQELSNLLAFWKKKLQEGQSKGVLPRFEYIKLQFAPDVIYVQQK